MDKLADIVQYLIADKKVRSRLCGICTSPDHSTDYCPLIQEDAIVNFPGAPQRQYNPYTNSYNLGLQDHPNFKYAQDQKQAFQLRQPPQQQVQK